MHLPNIEQLRSLATVGRAGSISGASNILHRSQSSISIQIKQLEENLGLQLLSRHPRGVSLTRDGERVVGYAEKILSLMHEMAQITGHGLETDTVRFGLTEEFTVGRLPQFLRQFVEMQRTFEIQVTVAETRQLEEQLENGSIDLLLGTTADMSRTPVVRWTTPLLWVANRQLRIDRSKPLPLILIAEKYRTWCGDILRQLDQAGIAWREVYSTTTFASVFSAAEAGLGVSYMIAECLRPSLRVLDASDRLPPLKPVEYGLFCRMDDASGGALKLLEVLQTALRIPGK